MLSSAKIAVITRTKNRPITLKRAIASVAGQTFKDYIHVIVNDGGNRDIVEELVAVGGIREKTIIIHNEASMGIVPPLNTGIRACDSKYILIHDDDDSLHPRFLEKTCSFMDINGERFCGVSSWITFIRESLNENRIIKLSEGLHFNEKTVSIGQMAANNQLLPIAFLYKRSLHGEIGYFDETLPVLEDWDFYLQALGRYDIGVLPEALAFYHQRVSTEESYLNSITGANDKHALYRHIVENKLFRMEMANGRIGAGLLSQINSMITVQTVSSEEYYVNSVISQINSNRPKTIAIYGTGRIASNLFYKLNQLDVCISCFIENDPNVNKIEGFMGLPVYSLKEAISSSYLDIAIGSLKYKNVIIDRIHNQTDVSNHRLRLYSV